MSHGMFRVNGSYSIFHSVANCGRVQSKAIMDEQRLRSETIVLEPIPFEQLVSCD